MKRVLVAGAGNIFLGDDGFGVEVARRLADYPVPEGVEVADVGIRGVHLAYQLLDGYDLFILVDALQRGGEPGTVYLIEPDLDAALPTPPGADGAQPLVDAHSMTPDAVFSTFKALGGTVGKALVVGCEPADVTEGIGLTPVVTAAVGPAADKVLELLTTLVPSPTGAGTGHTDSGPLSTERRDES
jgi:hydrogenase maturation protease